MTIRDHEFEVITDKLYVVLNGEVACFKKKKIKESYCCTEEPGRQDREFWETEYRDSEPQ